MGGKRCAEADCADQTRLRHDLIERSLDPAGGKASIHHGLDGISCDIELPMAAEPFAALANLPTASDKNGTPSLSAVDVRGARILVIEDETLIAMEMEDQLERAGCTVIGPVGTIEEATQIIAEGNLDAALVDANLAGRPVDEIAAALTQKKMPFAFATGYGRNGLPVGFQDAPLLPKPSGYGELLAIVRDLLSRSEIRPIRTTQASRRRGREQSA